MKPRSLIPAFTLGLLCFGVGTSALADAKPGSVENVSPRKAARARFIAYLDSEKHLGKLDMVRKKQLYINLRAQLGAPHAALDKYVPDAALLLQMKDVQKGVAEVELATRFGAKLVLRRFHHRADANGLAIAQLGLQHIAPDGTPTAAVPADLPLFGITKPKDFAALLERHMENLAPEDYEK